MNFQVMSKRSAVYYSEKIYRKTIIISIVDAKNESPKFADNPNIIDTLYLKFDDVDYDEENVMTREQANEIIKFVNKNINNIEEIIVHCEAGVSRSAGVCAGLMLIVNGDDTEIFSQSKYCPNRVCYRYILDAYYGNYENETLIEEKYKMNIAAFRKAEGLDDTDS